MIPQDGECYHAGHHAGMPRPRRPSAVYNPNYRYLIGRVREARVEAGLTQVAVANALGRPVSFVSKYELGERRLDPIDLAELAVLFEKPLEYFYPASLLRRRKGAKRG